MLGQGITRGNLFLIVILEQLAYQFDKEKNIAKTVNALE